MAPSMISSSCRGSFLLSRLLPTRSTELVCQIRFGQASSIELSFQPIRRFISRELPTESRSRLFNRTSLPVRFRRALPIGSSMRLRSSELPTESSMRLLCGTRFFNRELPTESSIRLRMRLLPTWSRDRLSDDGDWLSVSSVRHRFFISELPIVSSIRLFCRGVQSDPASAFPKCVLLKQKNANNYRVQVDNVFASSRMNKDTESPYKW